VTGQCCTGGTASSRPARLYLSTGTRATASILPGALLAVLPKCPLCIAAWLTVVTGVGISAAAAAWVSGIVVMIWFAAMALAAVSIFRRPASARVTSRVRTPSHSLSNT
jgi:hypothetical protein